MKHWTPQAVPVRRELCAPDREECTDQTPCDACPTARPCERHGVFMVCAACYCAGCDKPRSLCDCATLVEDDKWPEESAP